MNLQIEKNVSLAELTTLKIGGAARFYVSAKTENQIVEAVRFAEENGLEIFVLGGGSNVLIADAGFDGLVLHVRLKGVSLERESNETVLVNAQAGEDWDELAAFCVKENLQGFECLSGIPGLVGGTPVQNVGAYGQEVSETIRTVRVFDRKTGEIAELSNEQCGFAYRTSIFNTIEKNRYIVLSVVYALTENGAPKIAYRDLRQFFGDAQPNLAETRRAVLRIRAAKSMVVDASDPNSKSAGSFFKNPIISKEKFAEIEKRAAALNVEAVPFFNVSADQVKIPAAWLIEKSGLAKGFQMGRAGISTKHTLAIINRGAATAEEIISLKNLIQAKVEEVFGVQLKPEPIFVGFETE